MLTNIFRMIFYQQQAVRYLSLLAARPMVRGRLLRISPLMEVLRTPAELELVLSDANKLKTRTMICQHRYDNGETALKKHGGKVVTAHCQLPGCDYRMRKLITEQMPEGSWVEWPREPRSRAASSAYSRQSQPFSAPARHSMARPARKPPWTTQTSRASGATEEQWDEPDEEEPWDTVMEQDPDDGASSDL